MACIVGTSTPAARLKSDGDVMESVLSARPAEVRKAFGDEQVQHILDVLEMLGISRREALARARQWQAAERPDVIKGAGLQRAMRAAAAAAVIALTGPPQVTKAAGSAAGTAKPSIRKGGRVAESDDHVRRETFLARIYGSHVPEEREALWQELPGKGGTGRLDR